METFKELPAETAPVLQAADLGPVENKDSGVYRVSMFSSASYDKEWFRKMNEELDTGLTFTFHKTCLDQDSAKIAEGSQAVCIFVNDDCGEDTLRVLKEIGVEMVALRCAGFNNVNLEIAKELGIVVARVPAYSPHAVAEHAVALALSANRRIPQAYAQTRSNDFTLRGLLGNDLVNKRVGIIGTGLIGSISARIFKNGFNCDVIAYDAYPNARISDAPPNGLGIAYVELDELLKTADIILLHAPLLPATKHMINQEAIQQMKKGVIIINTSRGGLIDTEAFIQGVKDGIIGGAGLDVAEGEEPYFFKDWQGQVIQDDNIAVLLGFNNVTITPHQAFFTMEAMRTISHTTIANINGVRNGTGPPKQKGKRETVCLPPEK